MDSPVPAEELSLYNSAVENFTLSSTDYEECVNNNTTNGLTTDFSDSTINGNDDDNYMDFKTISATNSFQLSEDSSDCLEVDPKSQLANKTIFKTNNPNLSIIEISDTSTKEEENSVYLIESDGDNLEHIQKVNALLHSSKQKLNENSSNAKSDIKINKVSNSFGPKLVKQKNVEEINRNPSTSQRQIKVYDTVEEFEKNLPDTVTILSTQFGSKVYLVGTAHFSEDSQDDVSYVIRNVKPDIVMVELCPSRIHLLKLDEKTLLEEAKNLNMAKIRSIINANGFINGIFFILLLHTSANIAKELGMAPGGEFRRAFDEVVKIPGCMLHLGDRPINITLQRAIRALSLWQTIKLAWRLTSTENISIEEIEECKQRDLLEKLMQEVAGTFPAFNEVFVKERDLYLCHSLQVAALPQVTQQNGTPKPVKVVGVVGIGHAAGIAKNWGKVDPSDIPEILKIPPVRLSTRIFKYTVKYGFICCLAFGVFKFARPKLAKFF